MIAVKIILLIGGFATAVWGALMYLGASISDGGGRRPFMREGVVLFSIGTAVTIGSVVWMFF